MTPELRHQARRFYGSTAWRARRAAVLVRDRFRCTECGGEGREVHHVDPIAENNRAKWLDMENLRTLCSRCHESEHARMGGNPIYSKMVLERRNWQNELRQRYEVSND